MGWFKNIFNSESSKSKNIANSKKEVKPGDVALTVIITTFALGVLLSSSNLTGNFIGNLSSTTSNWIGVVLFAIGLVSVFIYIKKKTKSSKTKTKTPVSKRKKKKK